MIDTTLINRLHEMAKEAKKVKGFKARLRVKGRIIEKSVSKKGHIKLVIAKGEDEYTFHVLKTHKEKFALAKKLEVGRSITVEGISRFRGAICTKLKAAKSVGTGMQKKMNDYVS
ncbi:MAG: hypothetical protein KJ709_07225 [Nanoarchaeota archaeon]|nr:hypothetical protein [Nanoarchaeota archaeon]